jgi:thymidylate kinase|tara:strand:- start:9744 stop:10280 length:537 start_codon:yes stop_codon:yes gene_type:complete
MIIQVRGTSGSGKTTVMNEVMERLGERSSVYREGRKKPLYYSFPGGVAVLGHYESNCGGCDNIGSAPQVFELIQEVSKTHRTILCEGLLLSEDVKWATQMKGLKIVFLVTKIERCIRRVKKRRKDAGNDKPLNETNTRNRVAVIERAYGKLKALGTKCVKKKSTTATDLIMEWISDAK